jgi:hypothetical protein
VDLLGLANALRGAAVCGSGAAVSVTGAASVRSPGEHDDRGRQGDDGDQGDHQEAATWT